MLAGLLAALRSWFITSSLPELESLGVGAPVSAVPSLQRHTLVLRPANSEQHVDVIVSELIERRWYYLLLHNNRSSALKALVLSGESENQRHQRSVVSQELAKFLKEPSFQEQRQQYRVRLYRAVRGEYGIVVPAKRRKQPF